MATTPKKSKPRTPRQRMAARRARLRAQGLRPVQHWVPDLRNPKVLAEIRREIKMMAQHPENDAIDDWIEFGLRLGIVEIARGDVVLMVVPSDLGRPRPGVVVQTDELASDLSTVLICPISSDQQDRLLLRPLIEAAPENGLRLQSQIMTDKLVALRRHRIRRVIGRIDAETAEKLDRALLLVLGLAT